METIIYNNASLRYIIEAISHGTVGFSDDNNINDLLIVCATDNEVFKQIVIKPSVIDISKNILEFIGDKHESVDLVEDELLEFIVLTMVDELDDTGKKQKCLVNQSLSEYITLFPNINEFMSSNIWKLVSIK